MPIVGIVDRFLRIVGDLWYTFELVAWAGLWNTHLHVRVCYCGLVSLLCNTVGSGRADYCGLSPYCSLRVSIHNEPRDGCERAHTFRRGDVCSRLPLTHKQCVIATASE